MANRTETRTRLRMDIELRRNQTSLGYFRTRDMAALAVFIEAPGIALQLHDVIEMDFLLDGFGIRRHTQRGLVVRCAPDGVAVVFLAENVSLFQASPVRG